VDISLLIPTGDGGKVAAIMTKTEMRKYLVLSAWVAVGAAIADQLFLYWRGAADETAALFVGRFAGAFLGALVVFICIHLWRSRGKR
jgi:uncharacterized membrane protein YeaQ/YmgE (transglycosylase-associated protein family)